MFGGLGLNVNAAAQGRASNDITNLAVRLKPLYFPRYILLKREGFDVK
jgi:hypothetical protein